MAVTKKPAVPRPTANVPLDLRAQLAKESESIASKIAAGGGDRLSVSSTLIKTPDGAEGQELEVVIIDFMSTNFFYDRPYDKDNVFPPACFAIGPEPTLLVPSKNSPAKMADTCSVCPNNVFGSAMNGKGKACKNARLLAVVPADAEEGKTPIWTMSVPPASIKFFDSYVSTLAVKNKTIPLGVVTRLYLEEGSDWAAPRFEVVRPLTNEELVVFMGCRDEAKARLTAEPDVSEYEPPKTKRR